MFGNKCTLNVTLCVKRNTVRKYSAERVSEGGEKTWSYEIKIYGAVLGPMTNMRQG